MSKSSLPIINTGPEEDCFNSSPRRLSKVPMTPALETLLNPHLHNKEAIFTSPIRPPAEGEKIYHLSEEQIKALRDLRGNTIDLHPGMGGIAPHKLIDMIKQGKPLTSLDYMITRGCNFECTWCFAGSDPYQRDYLPFNVLESLTTEAADIGVSLFVLTGGEPLVYKDPALGKQKERGDHFFRIVQMIRDTYNRKDNPAKILTFDDVALITPKIAKNFADFEVGLCTKGDTLNPELQDFKVNQSGAFKKMQQGYENLMHVGYGKNPKLRLVVNSVLDHTTFDGIIDLHLWVMKNGFDHSIVPVHYCGNAENEDQEAGIHSPHVKVLYDLITRIDAAYFGVKWEAWSAFTYNKTCNRNRSGLHIRADGDVTACSESPGRSETNKYTFGNVLSDKNFSLRTLANSQQLAAYREEFAKGHGTYVCSPKVCDLYANDLCQGGCATRSAYSKIDYETGLIVKNDNPHSYSEFREDPLCPAWTVLAERQGVLKKSLLREIHDRLLSNSQSIEAREFPFS
ncbi:radical SAM protein [Candidatus Woesearchaeota archaeon]|nr:radical SAM protein [Candidatus Woesearchaeota archaeon]